MRNPDKLRVLPAAEDLSVNIYRLTSEFPRIEQFGLTSQLRRASVSIGSNIAEGAHRQGNKAFLPFLHNSLGSTGELRWQLGLAGRLEFGRVPALIETIDETEHMRA